MDKPTVKLLGEDGNIFNLMGIAKREMRRQGFETQADEMIAKIKECKNYNLALATIMEYCDVE